MFYYLQIEVDFWHGINQKQSLLIFQNPNNRTNHICRNFSRKVIRKYNYHFHALQTEVNLTLNLHKN